MRKRISPDSIETSISMWRPIDGGEDVLRQFHSEIMYEAESEPINIGSVLGWIGWKIADEDVHDTADAIGSDAEALGSAVREILRSYPNKFIDNALLIDRIHLATQWRGNRLTGSIIYNILDLLRFDPEHTVVVCQPEPQKSSGGPYEYGEERDHAMRRLTNSYKASGLRQWDSGNVWWLPFDA